ncbi:MAG: elongation factor 1-beta [Candidatus Asgardarchaeia archaeon]
MPDKVIVQLNVMPVDINVDLEELKNKIEKALPEDMIIHSYRIIPIAFGLSSLRLYVIMRHEEGGTDRLEEIIRNIDGVSEVEVGAVSLY